MNHSEIYWIAIRFMGLFLGFKALVSSVRVISLGWYLGYLNWGEFAESCGHLMAELTSFYPFLVSAIYTILFAILAYYFLFRGQKFHDVLLRKLTSRQP
jgi:hypothetical protein